MAGWTGRLVSVLVVIALAGTPALGATCAWLCGPGAAAEADTDTAHQAHHNGAAVHCHEAVDTASPGIIAPSDDAPCPLHRASSSGVTLAPGGLRSDAGTMSMAPVSKESPSASGLACFASLVTFHAHPRHRPPSQAPLVLRL